MNTRSQPRRRPTVLLVLAGYVALMPAAARPQSIPDSPLAPEEALTLFELHPDCRIELVASEPDVIDPVAIAFAPDGKLWVVEYSDYPNGPPRNGPPLSRIRTLTDADGDGRFTDAVTFADKLLFANGLLLWQDGVIVTTDGAVVFLRDTDGDGQADEQTEWFRGFARENPQLRANHPTLGLDGHIYIASGLRGGEVIAVREDWAKDAKPVSLSGRDFRFDPFTGEYEAVSGPSQFGLCFDPFGNRFNCDNRSPCRHIVLEDRYLARNPFLAVSQVYEDVSPKAENSHLYPISRTWTTSNLHANQFTAACGVLIYGGDALPQFRGNSLTCEPTANLVHRDVLEPQGATFTSHYGREGVEFLATRDEWFRPVNLIHGPDGALYVVDMYRAVIEHPQFMPDELKTRPDLTLGNDRGRIYRIVSRQPSARTHDSAFGTDPDSLVSHLASPNAWHRDTAFRLLIEQLHSIKNADDLRQRYTTIAELLRRMIKTDAPPQARAATVALLSAVGRSIGRSGAEWLAILDPDPRVQSLGLQLLDPHFDLDRGTIGQDAKMVSLKEHLLLAVNAENVEGRLAFQSTLALGTTQMTPSVENVLGGVAARYADDPWFRAAVASSSGGHEAAVLLAALRPARDRIANVKGATSEAPVELTRLFCTMIGSRGDAAGAARILAFVVEPITPMFDLSKQTDNERRAEWKRLQFATLVALANGLPRGKSSLSRAVDPLDDEQQTAIRALYDEARQLAATADRPSQTRVEAIAVVAIDPSPAATKALAELVRSETDQTVLVEAIAALARKSDERVADMLLTGFKTRTPSVRGAILNAMLAQTDRTTRLLDEVAAGNLSPRDIDAATAGRLMKSRDAKTNQRATKLFASAVDADRAQVLTTYEPCLSQTGDPQRGRAVFARICATCHKMGDVGTNVGPDISDSRTKTPEFLLTNILDPNRAVDGNYFGYTILDGEGRVHTGIITAETASSVTLRLPEGKDLTLLRQDIEDMTNTGLSLMPVGVEKDITVEAMADLISYIKNWRYLDGAVPEEVIGR